jgi:hypothetical protein
MEGKYTPGPWATTTLKISRNKFQTSVMAGDDHICKIGQENTDANAKLIAAAPDLLEALRDCQQVLFEYIFGDETPEMCCFAEAEGFALDVIRKATE